MELEIEETAGLTSIRNTKSTSTSNKDTSLVSVVINVWQRQPRRVKGLAALVSGFLVLGLLTIHLSGDSSWEEPVSKSTQQKKKFHSSNFGGVNNIAHPGGAKAHAEGLGLANDPDIFIPTSNLGHAVPSLSRENIVNHFGHYVHDEHRSPYASHLYDKPKQFLDEQQQQYVEKMARVRQEWGAWTDIEDRTNRPVADFDQVPYRDLPNSEFPPDSWQNDETYVGKLIPEARSLVERVKEGILAEYGHPLKLKDGTELSAEDKKKRDELFQVHQLVPVPTTGDNYDLHLPDSGSAWLTRAGMDGLVRKLLHSLLTNDEFYVVLGGHSAAAGHGNNFLQNKVLTMHHVLEPVFDKLGMRLISRNMGMGGVGTGQFSFAGKSLYGEADVMLWDSGMTEGGPVVDFFNKQAILAGSRMPVLLTAQRFNVLKETQGMAWVGDLRLDSSILPVTKNEVQVNEVPYAVRYMNVEEPSIAGNEKFNSVCWEDRKDVTPDVPQEAHPGSQVGWHPGFRAHQYEGRMLALVLLEGLKLALDQWEAGIATDGFPLAESYWHVGKVYEEIREKLRTHVNTENEDGSARSECEKMMDNLPRVCRVALQGFGMWTPRATKEFDFLNIVKEAPNGYKPTYPGEMQYNGIDLLPFSQAIPDGQVDVHAIAIATTNPPPDLDHEWTEDADSATNSTDTNSTDAAPPTRRWLRAATEDAWRKGISGPTDKKSVAVLSQDDEQSTNATNAENAVALDRKLEEAIIPGRGWVYSGWLPTDGFCDGTVMSECGRNHGQKCLLQGHNDCHKGLMGNSLSGWLVFTLPKVKEGIILARMEWWCGAPNKLTAGWTEVNDGKTNDTTPYVPDERRLKPGLDDLVPKDLEMDIAINGVITKTMQREEWLTYIKEYSKNCAVWPLLNNEEMAKREDFEGEEIEVAIRFRTKEMPQQGYCISHVYYA